MNWVVGTVVHVIAEFKSAAAAQRPQKAEDVPVVEERELLQ